MTNSNDYKSLKPSEQLKLALKLLTYKGWTKNTYARDAQGLATLAVQTGLDNVGPAPTPACSFCAAGALVHLQQSYHAWTDAEDYLQRALPTWSTSVPMYNDDPRCEFKHVRALYCKAIRLALADEQKAAEVAS